MNQTLMLMKLGSAGSSTQERVIRLLGEKWPLTAKEIHREITHNEKGLSYQAVHKMLVVMADSHVIARNGNAFELSKDWVSGMRKYFSEMDEKYQGTLGKYEFQAGKEETVWKFTDYSTLAVTIARLLMSKKLVGKENAVGIGVLRHGMFPLEFNFYDFDLVVKMVSFNGGGYGLIESDTPLDRWICGQYLKGGFTGAKFGVKDLNIQKDLIFHGAHYIEIEYSDESKKFLDNFFENTDGIDSLYQNFLKKKTSNKLDITVRIVKNPELVQFMRNQLIEKYFGEKK